MHLQECAKMALSAIWTHKLRSGLTLLGVIIGVTTIIAMMTVIAGLQRQIEKDMSELSPNTFQVQRYDIQMGFDHDFNRRKYRPPIKREDAEAIAQYCPSVGLVGPEVWIMGGTEAVYRDKKTNPNIFIAGGTPEFAINNGYFVDEGRFITTADDDFNRMVVVIGLGIKEKLFEYESPLGRQIKIDGNRYTVIGILEDLGSMWGDNRNYHLVIPLSTFEKIYGDKRSLNITVQAKSSAVFEQAKEEVIDVMRSQRGLKPNEDNNFAVWSSNTLIDTFNKMTFWIKIAAVGICGISLLVAGIGIMNIMLVSVTERTREIGVRKAIGGKKRHIMTQFIIEAIVLSEIGGIIGVGMGFAVGKLFGLAAKMPTAIPIWSVVLGLLFCSMVGLFFGIWPAAKAANLKPIEALRYE
jgi:putative ABC transport system permease protein